MYKFVVIAATCCAFHVPAADALVFWNMTGTVSSVSSTNSVVSVGDELKFRMGFNITPDLDNSSPGLGWYGTYSGSGSLQVGSTYAHLVQSSAGNIDVGNYISGDYIRADVRYNVSGSRLIEAQQEYTEAFSLRATGPSSALSSDRLNGETISSEMLPDYTIFHSVYYDGNRFDIGYSNVKWSFSPPVASVPEPSTWMMMILGFGAVGGAIRRRPSVTTKVRFA